VAVDHDVPAGVSPGPAPVVHGPQPSDAERARSLAARVTAGVLSTVARDPRGTPYGSVAPFGVDGEGRPVLCISEIAEHTRNLRADPRSSLLVLEPLPRGSDPLAAGRLTLLGRTEPVPPAELDGACAVHLAANPYASGYLDFGDFSLWRLEVASLRYIGGYGHMSWVDADGWRRARPDPLAADVDGILAHLNADHAEACLLLVRRLAGRDDSTAAVATGVDRYGLELDATGPEGTARVRLGFDQPVTTSEAVRKATVALVRRARG
jgi:heme iron utilization protein